MSNRHLLKEGNGIVYHYTSIDTFLKILDGIRFDHFIFHGTDIFSMNDPTEFIHGYRQLLSILPEIENDLYNNIRNNPQIFNIDDCYLDKRYKLSHMWNILNGSDEEWLKTYIEAMHQSYDSPFVISFSCHDDFLPMWSTYGDNGNGVAIGIDIQDYYTKRELNDGTLLFDFTRINENELCSFMVSYDILSVKHPLAKYVRICIGNYLKSIPCPDIDDLTLFRLQMESFNKITKLASALIKDEAYQYEEESRIIYEKQDIRDIKFKITPSKKILAYIHVGIPVSKFKRVVIGPCNDFQATKISLRTRFEQLGIYLADDYFVRSKVPYRKL